MRNDYTYRTTFTGWNGSGTIFFGLCNLRCVFCQNWDISQRKKGWELEADEIADLMLKLQNETKYVGNDMDVYSTFTGMSRVHNLTSRCHNVNFVTPEHVVPQVIEAIHVAVKKFFNLPIVYNTSSYDSERSLELLDGLIDIYMPDFKFWLPETSQRYCKARDYPQVAKTAIKAMHKQVGDLVFDQDGLAKKGLLVRHLVMPNHVDEGKNIMRWLAEEVSKDTYVNVMEQYRPEFTVGKGEKRARGGFTAYEEIDRPITDTEATEVKKYACEVGLWRFEDNVWLPDPAR